MEKIVNNGGRAESDRKSVESRFIRNVERLADGDLRSVLRDRTCAHAIDCVNWSEYPYAPKATFRVAHSDDAVAVMFEVEESHVRAVALDDNGPVWEDSCVEFFVAAPDGEGYFNFEVNCIATALAARRVSRAEADHFDAERMARIANVSLEELGQQIFSASWSDDKTPEELLFTDFKDFHIAGHDLGVGQITCVNSAHILERKQEFLDIMQQTMQERHYSLMLLMLTDVLLEGTQLIYLGDEETIQQAFSSEAKNNVVFLPGVMSRKKQIIPTLSAMWG